MKKSILMIMVLGIGVVGCRREPGHEIEDNDADSIITTDSTVSGTLEVSPDSLDATLPVDSTDYNVDSIKNIK